MGGNLQAIDVGTGRSVSSFAIGFYHMCAVLDDATLKCWGSNAYGVLGYGDTVFRGAATNTMGDYLPAVNLGQGLTAKQVTCGFAHTCAVLNDASVKCWGKSWEGQLGRKGFVNFGSSPDEMCDVLLPIQLGPGRTAKQIATGKDFNCVLLDTDVVKCWGYQTNGQLGFYYTMYEL